jgi:hypothetical protein
MIYLQTGLMPGDFANQIIWRSKNSFQLTL